MVKVGFRLLSLIWVLLLSGCFVSSPKPLVSSNTNPGLPKQDFVLQLMDGPVKLGLNVVFNVNPNRGQYDFYEVASLAKARYDGKKASPNAVRFLPLPQDDDLYVLQYKSSSSNYYYVLLRQGDRFYVNDMKLNKEELTRAKERGVQGVGNYGVSLNSQHDLVMYAQYWLQQKGRGWIHDDAQTFTYRVVSNPDQQQEIRARHEDFMCLAYAGHPDDRVVQSQRPPFNVGKLLPAINVGNAKAYCSHGAKSGASPSVRYALARAKFKNREYTGTNQEPGALDLARDLASDGFGLGNVLLAEAYSNGLGVDRNRKKAATILQSASQDDVNVLYSMGAHHQSGTFGKINYIEARDYFQRAANKGNASAMAALGIIYKFGRGVQKDYDKAVELFRQAADHQNAVGQTELGKSYYFGNGVKKNYSTANSHFIKAIQQGNGEASYYAGYLHLYGLGVRKNRSTALSNFKKSVDRNFTAGRHAYAETYYDNLQTAKRDKHYHRWLEEASDRGRRSAHYVLAKKYLQGFDVQPSLSKGLSLLEKAIAKDHWKSMQYLGGLYERGEYVQRNYDEAQRLYQKAANQGSLDGMYRLAEFYRTGKAGNAKKAEAKSWYQKAANKGHARSKQALKKYTNLSSSSVVDLQAERERARKYEKWARGGQDAYYYQAGLVYLNKLKDPDNAEKNFLVAAKKGDTWSQYYMGVMHSQYGNYPKHWKPEFALMWLYTAEKTGLKAGKKVTVISNYYKSLEKTMKAEARIKALDRSRECFSSNYQKC